MLDTLLRVVGVDLQGQIAQAKAQLEAFKEETKQEARQEIKEAGIITGLASAAIAASVGTCVVALAALYIWVDRQSGPFAALAAVGSLTALSAVVLFALTMARANRKPAFRPAAAATIRPAAAAPPLPATPATALNAAKFIQPPPTDASLFDVFAHRVTSRAAGAADEAIDAASDLVGNGSRNALMGTLAVTLLVGLMIGRQHRV